MSGGELRILELFSGIGGMHEAFNYAGLSGKFTTAIDINTVANEVYKHNHPEIQVQNKNIQKIDVASINKAGVNMILMSPPCQPHTRQGLRKDLEDKRSDALQHISEILPQCSSVKYVLMENVKGFETSNAREVFLAALIKGEFFYREFILSPIQFGIPNNRHRYYCLARKGNDFSFENNQIYEDIPPSFQKNWAEVKLETFLDRKNDISIENFVPLEALTKRIWLMDIVHSKSKYTMCFTKSYTHYHEGTGSIISELNESSLKEGLEKIKHFEKDSESVISEENENIRLELFKNLKLRFFTPVEVRKLMSFPDHFTFPPSITTRQKYRLLGNSINVKVVGELLRILCS